MTKKMAKPAILRPTSNVQRHFVGAGLAKDI